MLDRVVVFSLTVVAFGYVKAAWLFETLLEQDIGF